MRNASERAAIRREIMQGVNDADTTVVEAILELCRTLDELGQNMAAAQAETRLAIDRMSHDVSRVKTAALSQ